MSCSTPSIPSHAHRLRFCSMKSSRDPVIGTTRTVADGRYEVKSSPRMPRQPALRAKPASRFTRPDRGLGGWKYITPPVVGDLKWAQKGPAIQLDFNLPTKPHRRPRATTCGFQAGLAMSLPVDNSSIRRGYDCMFSIPGLSRASTYHAAGHHAKGEQSFRRSSLPSRTRFRLDRGLSQRNRNPLSSTPIRSAK